MSGRTWQESRDDPTPSGSDGGAEGLRELLSRDARELAQSAHVTHETLVVWGEQDPALGVELLEGLERVAPRVRVHRIPHASHWVQNEVPDEVNRILIDFLR